MRKYTSIGLSILVLLGVIISMALWLRALKTSIYNYRSPLRALDLPQAAAPPPQSNKVVIVLISGLGYDTSLALELPVFEQLKQTGAHAAVESVPPTFSQTAWGTLISGAPPETNDAPPVDIPLEDLRLLQVGTLFERVHTARLQTALLGIADWRYMLPRNYLNHTFFVDEPEPEADRIILEAALPLLESDQPDLMLIHFSQLNVAGGPSSPTYLESAHTLDGYLEQISTAMDLKRSVLVVVSDHGQTADGGYGGTEVDVIWQPLVMVGGNTIPGEFSDIHQTDIVPTLATLLGLTPPGSARGRILFEMMRLNKQERAVAQIALAQQRVALAQAYLSQIQGDDAILPQTMIDDLARAQTALDAQNADGAFELAILTQRRADAEMNVARDSQIRGKQLPRLVITAFIVFIWTVILWRRRGLHAGSVIMAVAVTIGLYHGLYQLLGYEYSISTLTLFDQPSGFLFDTARRVAVSMLAGGGLLLIFFMLTSETNGVVLLGSAYGFSILVTFIFMLSFFWGYWQNGWVATWHLPNVDAAFWQISGAIEAINAAALGLILPWPIMIFSLFINLIRRRLDEARRPKTSEPGTLPGLHL